MNKKEIFRIAGTLTAIALTVSLVLGAVNFLTADRIEKINQTNTYNALRTVFPQENSTFEIIEKIDVLAAEASRHSAKLKAVYRVKGADGFGGYAIKVVAAGSQGDIEMIVGILPDCTVGGVSVVSSSETSGIGTKVTNNEGGVLDHFKGAKGAGSLTVGVNVDAVSGATVSTKGVTKGVNGALAVAEMLAQTDKAVQK